MAVSQIDPIDDLKTVLDDIEDRRGMSAGIAAMRTRRGMFRDDLDMMLTGVGVIPEARRMLNDRLTQTWERRHLNPFVGYANQEVIIGAGFAAAVYCATRVQMGFPRPVVIDTAPASGIGGTFAMGNNSPVFYLNSGNRPGSVGAPGNVNSSLNYIPGAPVQPANLSGREYQTNEDMALAIRLALMQWANVYPGEKIASVDTREPQPVISPENGPAFTAGRVINACGLGEPADRDMANGTTILTFPQLMDRMGRETFPLSGLGRVAVRGSGDSAKCAVESLLGISPSTGMSVAGMDFVPEITWYAPGLPDTCQSWRETQRGRYQRIGSYLRRRPEEFSDAPRQATTRRLTIIPQRGRITPTLEGAIVNDINYDTVITCVGNTLPSLTGVETNSMEYVYTGPNFSGSVVGRQINNYYMIGTAADLPFTNTEIRAGFDAIEANRVAMFRYAPKISALAASLPGV